MSVTAIRSGCCAAPATPASSAAAQAPATIPIRSDLRMQGSSDAGPPVGGAPASPGGVTTGGGVSVNFARRGPERRAQPEPWAVGGEAAQRGGDAGGAHQRGGLSVAQSALQRDGSAGQART